MKTFLKKIRNKIQYKKISIHPTVNLINSGSFNYGNNCIVDKECTVVISGSLTLGNDVIILKDTDIDAWNIKIGNNVSIQKHSFIFGNVTIGSYCLFAPNIFISSGGHEFKQIPSLNIKDQDKLEKTSSPKSITIGEDCWLGINVVVSPGVTIGKGCIVGANSVVNKDIPPYSIAAGAPVRIISQRFNFCPPKMITPSVENIPYFYSGFETSKDKISADKISLASNVVEVFLNFDDAKFIKLKAVNASVCTVNSKKHDIQDGIFTISLEECINPVAITFDKNEFSQIRIEKIWTE